MRSPLLRIHALFLMLSTVALCQTAGTISGRMHDATGSVIQNAKVTAVQVERGIRHRTVSDERGRFVLPYLPAGNYDLQVEATGFRVQVRKGMELTVAQTIWLDLVLEVGDSAQQITVTAAAPLVNTTTHELAYLVNEQAIRELPLNGRNITDLALLQPGVTPYPHRDGGSVVAHGLGMSINGQDPRSNVYLMDGTPHNDFTNGTAGSAAGTALGAETIR